MLTALSILSTTGLTMHDFAILLAAGMRTVPLVPYSHGRRVEDVAAVDIGVMVMASWGVATLVELTKSRIFFEVVRFIVQGTLGCGNSF